MRWSVGIEVEGDRVLTREEVVELADAVAASGGIATGIGSTRYGAQLIVEAGSRDEAIEKATGEFWRAASKAALPARGQAGQVRGHLRGPLRRPDGGAVPIPAPRAHCWVKRAGSRWKVYVCTYEVPGGSRGHREQITRELTAIYRPRCNDRYGDDQQPQDGGGRARARDEEVLMVAHHAAALSGIGGHLAEACPLTYAAARCRSLLCAAIGEGRLGVDRGHGDRVAYTIHTVNDIGACTVVHGVVRGGVAK